MRKHRKVLAARMMASLDQLVAMTVREQARIIPDHKSARLVLLAGSLFAATQGVDESHVMVRMPRRYRNRRLIEMNQEDA